MLGVVAWFTIAGVIFVGAMLLVAGVLQIIHAFMDRAWRAFILDLLVGLLYVAGGFLPSARHGGSSTEAKAPLLASGKWDC